MIIKSYLHNYEVLTNKKIDFNEILNSYECSLIVIDTKVYKLYKNNAFANISKLRIFLVDAKEENKTVEKALEICGIMTEFPAKKNSVIISVGGGIIQDICTFAANVLYRGTRLILVPTTLLAQADSCIGSKSSLNFGNYKNMLGYFYPPEKIYVSFDFLKTLDDIDYRSGIGEIFKISIMAGPESVKRLSHSLSDILSRDYNKLLPFVNFALSFKKELIEVDEFDIGKRRILNYGHTFGHAIEAVSNYEVPHGIAVVMGILIANEISFKRGYISKEYKESLEEMANLIIPCKLVSYKPKANEFIAAVKKDKKRQGNKIAGVLLDSEESLKVFQDISEDELVGAIR